MWVIIKLTATNFMWAIESLSEESLTTCSNKHMPNTEKLTPQFTIVVKHFRHVMLYVISSFLLL